MATSETWMFLTRLIRRNLFPPAQIPRWNVGLANGSMLIFWATIFATSLASLHRKRDLRMKKVLWLVLFPEIQECSTWERLAKGRSGPANRDRINATRF